MHNTNKSIQNWNMPGISKEARQNQENVNVFQQSCRKYRFLKAFEHFQWISFDHEEARSKILLSHNRSRGKVWSKRIIFLNTKFLNVKNMSILNCLGHNVLSNKDRFIKRVKFERFYRMANFTYQSWLIVYQRRNYLIPFRHPESYIIYNNSWSQFF